MQFAYPNIVDIHLIIYFLQSFLEPIITMHPSSAENRILSIPLEDKFAVEFWSMTTINALKNIVFLLMAHLVYPLDL